MRISLECQLLGAMALDFAVGDPRWFPHPVRGIGWLAIQLETWTRRGFRSARLAGIITLILVLAATGAAAAGLLALLGWWSPLAADLGGLFLIYLCLATRDLADHAWRVEKALSDDDLELARRQVAMIVSRDANLLDRRGVARSAIESVGENLIDGVTSPLFFCLLGGPVAGCLFKAASTMDSMVGYRTERYLLFGWASARFDDLLNWIPARLTFPFIALAAAILRLRPLAALRLGWRDRRKHASPNSMWGEAPMAGALGIQLGGPTPYHGTWREMPLIGEPVEELQPVHIRRSVRLMILVAILFLAAGLAVRLLITN